MRELMHAAQAALKVYAEKREAVIVRPAYEPAFRVEGIRNRSSLLYALVAVPVFGGGYWIKHVAYRQRTDAEPTWQVLGSRRWVDDAGLQRAVKNQR